MVAWARDRALFASVSRHAAGGRLQLAASPGARCNCQWREPGIAAGPTMVEAQCRNQDFEGGVFKPLGFDTNAEKAHGAASRACW